MCIYINTKYCRSIPLSSWKKYTIRLIIDARVFMFLENPEKLQKEVSFEGDQRRSQIFMEMVSREENFTSLI